MKHLAIALMLMLPATAVTAQDNSWERTEQTSNQTPDQKYLEGAVPVVDGHVTFQTTIKAPGKSARQIYDIMQQQLTKMTKEEGQYEQSRIVLEDPDKTSLVGSYQEQLVFKKRALEFDYTRLMYHLFVDCRDGEATVRMTRIYYLYEEERDPQTFRAEEWITDQFGLNKKKTKLARVSGKFRRKTIDRKDYLFNKFSTLLNQ